MYYLKNPSIEIDYDVSILTRPSWDDYFFGLAFLISQRSCDWSTKHATIGADSKNRIIGCGYNGLVRGVDDEKIPRNREEKNRRTLHSEVNFLHNVKRDILDSDRVYITGFPCLSCTSQLIQAGITKILTADRKGYSKPPSTQENDVRELCLETNTCIEVIKPNLNWLYDEKLKGELTDLGFLPIK